MKKYALCLDYGEGFWEFFLTGGYHLHLVLNEEERVREVFVNYDCIVPYILIENPRTDKEREFNSALIPNGNPFEQSINDLLSYAKELPNAHKDKMLHKKMDEMFTNGIEVRLLNKAEYIERLKEKVRKGQRLFLLDWQKPITIEEIEAHQDELWGV